MCFTLIVCANVIVASIMPDSCQQPISENLEAVPKRGHVNWTLFFRINILEAQMFYRLQMLFILTQSHCFW